jgi:predicted dehydrogenase
MDLKAAIIGCGKPWRSEGATGFGISHGHAKGYAANPDLRLAALADIVEENARAFQEMHGGERIYTDYREMLEKERPDIVSICTWTGLHEQMVLDCAAAKVPAVHCEKPIAPTWAAAKRMVTACEASGTQLTFNHQRRFDPAYVKAKALLKEGVIGQLRTLEMPTNNLFDWGTHWFDMMFFYNDQIPAKWVLGQVEPTGGSTVFGVKLEGQGISLVGFENGVQGVMPTGKEPGWGVQNRLVGSEGVIEIGATGWDSLRYLSSAKAGWVEVDTKLPEGEPDSFGKSLADIAASLREGREPELSGRKALMATELIFATYESARRGGRIDLPLRAEDVEILAA